MGGPIRAAGEERLPRNEKFDVLFFFGSIFGCDWSLKNEISGFCSFCMVKSISGYFLGTNMNFVLKNVNLSDDFLLFFFRGSIFGCLGPPLVR
jgi:hypothetical protein